MYYFIIFGIILVFFSWKTYSLFSYKRNPVLLENIDQEIIQLLNGDDDNDR